MPDNAQLMYGMNYFALQLNLMSENMKKLLPPTDSRLRPDIRLWERGLAKEAGAEKTRLEKNQRDRKKIIKKQLPDVNTGDEQSYYNPKFFNRS